MELRISSPKLKGQSPDCLSDPEEKEVSDDDDDDRNHKHRRRGERSQSLERDALEPGYIRPYKKRNRPFENGHSLRESDSHYGPTTERDFSSKFDKRRTGVTFPRIRVNQSFTGEMGPGRGRARDLGSWGQRDLRFNSVDLASQMVQQGSIPSSLFGKRGLPNIPSAQNAPWPPFGLLPGMPNGGLDSIHPISLQGTLRPPINPPLNMGIPRPRCRDFEERGYCLRGDMCPMEHGMNRIVVEDVQSLSKFNLPVSLPSAHLLGAPAGTAPLHSVTAPSSTMMSSKTLHTRSNKTGVTEDISGFNTVLSSSGGGGGGDFYDPDQPLWTNNGPETSTALLALHSSKFEESENLLDSDPAERHLTRVSDPVDSDRSGVSVWGRIGSSKANKPEVKDNNMEKEVKEDQEALTTVQSGSRQGKPLDMSPKSHGEIVRNTRKPSQKALRTLFVNGIPSKNNRKEALLSHFRKFGEIIDIYIPSNSERAFVQFSKREEAEAALEAPDAVMGNRFIKLFWANRDSILDDGTSHSNSMVSGPSHPAVIIKGKVNLPTAAPKLSTARASEVPLPTFDTPKTPIANGPKTQPKKLELELLKEELRKKQEMLDQKRNDFRRQLDKLEKQTTGLKSEVTSDQATKRQKATTLRTSDPNTAVASPRAELLDKNKATNSSTSLPDPTSLKQPIHPLAPASTSFLTNRFKLDNRPTSFRIVPPLPSGFANVGVIKERFSSYDDPCSVELEDQAVDGSCNSSESPENFGARVSFTTRHSAERAFTSAKIWKGHNLQFKWLSNNSSNISHRETSSPPKPPSVPEAQPSGTLAASQESGDSDSRKSDGEHTSPRQLIEEEDVSILEFVQ